MLWSCLRLSQLLWSSLRLSELLWSCLRLSELLWSCLRLSGLLLQCLSICWLSELLRSCLSNDRPPKLLRNSLRIELKHTSLLLRNLPLLLLGQDLLPGVEHKLWLLGYWLCSTCWE